MQGTGLENTKTEIKHDIYTELPAHPGHMGACMFIRVHAHTDTTHTHFLGCVSGEAGLPAWPVPAPVGRACAHVPAGETLQPAVMGRADRHGL